MLNEVNKSAMLIRVNMSVMLIRVNRSSVHYRVNMSAMLIRVNMSAMLTRHVCYRLLLIEELTHISDVCTECMLSLQVNNFEMLALNICYSTEWQ